MKIQNIRETTGFVAAGLAPKPEKNTDAAAGPSADRVELSRQWAERMEEQRKQLLSLLSQPTQQSKKKNSNALLDMLDRVSESNEEADAMAKQLKTRMKCVEIARRIMQGKKVPLKDERFLMENDPKGYQLAMAMRKPPKKDEKECKSVLDDEDEESSGGEEAAPVETSGIEGEITVSDSTETTE